MKTALFLAAAFAFLPLHAQQGAATLPGANVPMCAADDLSLDTDDENGNFDATSHSGVLVVLRNVSSRACRVHAIPQIQFSDKTGPLKAKGEMAGFTRPGLGHGPVVLPVIVAAGAELTSSLRWVSGEVFDQNTCISPTTLSVTIQGGKQSTPLQAHLCGDTDHGGITFEQTRFALDPVYTPAVQ